MKSMSLKLLCYGCLLLFAGCDCNPSSRRQNLARVYQLEYCLDVGRTAEFNHIMIGPGKLSFNKDMTLKITNDSLSYSGIKGKWDISSYADYGNFIFKIEGFDDQVTNTPEFSVVAGGKKITLFFKSCT
jgi:hypothetical protein